MEKLESAIADLEQNSEKREENLKMKKVIPNLETIFVSVKYEELDLLNKIMEAPEVSKDNKKVIEAFITKCREVGYILSPDIIQATLGIKFVEKFVEKYQAVSNVSQYIDQYIMYAKRLKMADILNDLSSKVIEDGITSEVMKKLNGLISTSAVALDYNNITTSNLMNQYENKHIKQSNISTCDRVLDDTLGGLRKGDLTSILGASGCFKTSWALNIAYAAQLKGMNTLYLSLEVSKEDILFNLLSRHSNQEKFTKQIPHWKLKQKTLNQQQLEYLKAQIIPDYDQLKGKIYAVDKRDVGSYSLYALEQKFTEINNLAVQQTGHGIDICVIDHINLLKFGESKFDVTDTYNKYASFFREQAFDWCRTKEQVAMIVIAQANRKGKKYAGEHHGNYLTEHFAEGSELERSSSVVLTVYSDDNLKILYEAKVGLIKNRDGAPIESAFETPIEPEYYTFGNVIVNQDIVGIDSKFVPPATLDEIMERVEQEQKPRFEPIEFDLD